MLKVDIQADSKFPVDRKAIRKRIAEVLLRLGVDEAVRVSVSVVGDRKMQTLNKQYRKKDYTTDVLSFPTKDPSQEIADEKFFHSEEIGVVLGDIVVSHPQAVLTASRRNEMLDVIVCDLVEHGMLHLLGYHHD